MFLVTNLNYNCSIAGAKPLSHTNKSTKLERCGQGGLYPNFVKNKMDLYNLISVIINFELLCYVLAIYILFWAKKTF